MTTERNPENTRMKLLGATFQELHKHGFQGMRIDRVLKNTNLKKGALYHHFSGKQALGYAVLEELIKKHIVELWIEPLKSLDNPLEEIPTLFDELDKVWSHEFFTLGCPLNNLAQEMSPIDTGFRERINAIFQEWKLAISEALKTGQKQNIVDPAINTDDCANFILAAIEGALGMTKNNQNKEAYYSCSRELKRYMNTLKTK